MFLLHPSTPLSGPATKTGIICISSLALLLTGCYAITPPGAQGAYGQPYQAPAVENANIQIHTPALASTTQQPPAAPPTAVPAMPANANPAPHPVQAQTVTTQPAIAQQQRLFLQAGSFLNESGAQAVVRNIQNKVPALAALTHVSLRGDMHRVLIGPFGTEHQRQQAANLLHDQAQADTIRITH